MSLITCLTEYHAVRSVTATAAPPRDTFPSRGSRGSRSCVLLALRRRAPTGRCRRRARAPAPAGAGECVAHAHQVEEVRRAKVGAKAGEHRLPGTQLGCVRGVPGAGAGRCGPDAAAVL